MSRIRLIKNLGFISSLGHMRTVRVLLVAVVVGAAQPSLGTSTRQVVHYSPLSRITCSALSLAPTSSHQPLLHFFQPVRSWPIVFRRDLNRGNHSRRLFRFIAQRGISVVVLTTVWLLNSSDRIAAIASDLHHAKTSLSSRAAKGSWDIAQRQIDPKLIQSLADYLTEQSNFPDPESSTAFRSSMLRFAGSLEGQGAVAPAAAVGYWAERPEGPGGRTALHYSLFINPETAKTLLKNQKKSELWKRLLNAVVIKEGSTILHIQTHAEFYVNLINHRQSFLPGSNGADPSIALRTAAESTESEAAGYRPVVDYLESEKVNQGTLEAAMDTTQEPGTKGLLARLAAVLRAVQGKQGPERDYALKKNIYQNDVSCAYPLLAEVVNKISKGPDSKRFAFLIDPDLLNLERRFTRGISFKPKTYHRPYEVAA